MANTRVFPSTILKVLVLIGFTSCFRDLVAQQSDAEKAVQEILDEMDSRPKFRLYSGFSEPDSLAIIRENDRYGLIDVDSNYVLVPMAKKITRLGIDVLGNHNSWIRGYYVIDYLDKDSVGLFNGIERIMVFETKGRHISVWNREDSFLKISSSYSHVTPRGRSTGSLTGLAHLKGVIHYPIPGHIAPVGHGLYVYEDKNRKYYLANKEGRNLNREGYDWIWPQSFNGHFVYMSLEKQGLLDKNGKEVLLDEWYIRGYIGYQDDEWRYPQRIDKSRYIPISTLDKNYHNLFDTETQTMAFSQFADSVSRAVYYIKAYFFNDVDGNPESVSVLVKHDYYGEYIVHSLKGGHVEMPPVARSITITDSQEIRFYNLRMKLMFQYPIEEVKSFEMQNSMYYVETKAGYMLYLQDSGDYLSTWKIKPEVYASSNNRFDSLVIIQKRQSKWRIYSTRGQLIVPEAFDSVWRDTIEKQVIQELPRENDTYSWQETILVPRVYLKREEEIRTLGNVLRAYGFHKD